MKNPNIYQIMKVSNEIDHLAVESSSNSQNENDNLGFWILGGVLILGLVYYLNQPENQVKKSK